MTLSDCMDVAHINMNAHNTQEAGWAARFTKIKHNDLVKFLSGVIFHQKNLDIAFPK